MASSFTPETFAGFVRDHFPSFEYTPGSGELINYQALFDQLIDMQKSIPTVGASGAVYGILLAFGMTFPDLQLMLLFPPIPIKAKWLVVIYGGLELVFGLTQPGSSIAHFAHLGGMLIGFILIKLWAKKNHGSNF